MILSSLVIPLTRLPILSQLSVLHLISKILAPSIIFWVFKSHPPSMALPYHRLNMPLMFFIVSICIIPSLQKHHVVLPQDLTPNSGLHLSDPSTYRSMIGALQYLTFTRPDLAFSVHQLCQFMQFPTTTNLEAAKRVLRYVRGTLSHGIYFSHGPLTLTAFTDADWAGDPFDRKSTTGFMVFLGSNPISWSSKKQSTVSRSSTEAECRALATTAAELS